MKSWIEIIRQSILSQKEIVQFQVQQDSGFLKKLEPILTVLTLNSGYMGYLVRDFSSEYSSNGNVKILIRYRQSQKETNDIDAIAGAFVKKNISSGMTELEKILVVHDFLCHSIQYDSSYSIRTPYHAFLSKKSVCSGFALLFGLFLKKAGITQYFVSGRSIDPGTRKKDNHIWNKVKLGNLIYNIDLTWDSCVRDLNPYAYFCVTDLQIQSSHFPDTNQNGIPLSTTKVFYQTIDFKTASSRIKKIQGSVSPGLLVNDPTQLMNLIQSEGVYKFSIPLGTDLQKLLKKFLNLTKIPIQKYEVNSFHEYVMKIERVTLKVYFHH